jgi:hypothetical protein
LFHATSFIHSTTTTGKGIDFSSFYGTFDAHAAVGTILDNLRVSFKKGGRFVNKKEENQKICGFSRSYFYFLI